VVHPPLLSVQIFQVKSAATSISAPRLKTLVVELLLWLLDDRVPRIEAGNQLLKALNVLMLKILVRILWSSLSSLWGNEFEVLCRVSESSLWLAPS
jgi:hypothetical protein